MMLRITKMKYMIPWDISLRNSFNNIKVMVKMNTIMKKMKCIKILMLKNNHKGLIMGSENLINNNNNKKMKKIFSKILIIQVSKILVSNKKKHKILKKINFRILQNSEILLSFQKLSSKKNNQKRKKVNKRIKKCLHPTYFMLAMRINTNWGTSFLTSIS